MNKKKVWQYKCDFCGKKNYSAGHMKSHEKHCTMNPDRECRMCKLSEAPNNDLAELIRYMKDPEYAILPEDASNGSTHETLKNKEELESYLEGLWEKANFCPACVLAVLRQKKIHPNDIGFDWKKEVAHFWEDHNCE